MVSLILADSQDFKIESLIFESFGIPRTALTLTIYVAVLAAMFLGVLSVIEILMTERA